MRDIQAERERRILWIMACFGMMILLLWTAINAVLEYRLYNQAMELAAVKERYEERNRVMTKSLKGIWPKKEETKEVRNHGRR